MTDRMSSQEKDRSTQQMLNPHVDHEEVQMAHLDTQDIALEIQREMEDNAECLRKEEESLSFPCFEESQRFETEVMSAIQQYEINEEIQRRYNKLQATLKRSQELLHDELEGLNITYFEDSFRLENELSNIRQHSDNLQAELEHQVHQKLLLQKELEELKVTTRHVQETITAELRTEKERNQILHDELENVNVLHNEDSRRFESELRKLREQADTLHCELEKEFSQKSLLQKEFEEFKEIVKCTQETIADEELKDRTGSILEAIDAELQVGIQRSKILQQKLEVVNVSGLEAFQGLESQLTNLRQQADTLQGEREQEINQKTPLQQEYEELKETMRHMQESIATELKAEKKKNQLLQDELESIIVLHNVESFKFQTELRNLRQEADTLRGEFQHELDQKSFLQTEGEELKERMTCTQAKISAELQVDNQNNNLQDELKRLKVSYTTDSHKFETELNNLREQVDTLQGKLELEVRLKSLIQRQYEEQKETIRGLQDSFAAELQAEKLKNQLLQDELEGVSVVHHEDSSKYGTELNNLRQEADTLRGKLEHEVWELNNLRQQTGNLQVELEHKVHQRSLLQKEHEELKETMRCVQEAIVADLHVEKQKKECLREELQSFSVSCNEEYCKLETELSATRKQDDTLQGELEHNIYQKSLLQQQYEELKETMRHMQEAIAAELQKEKQKNQFLCDELEDITVLHNEESQKFERELNNLKQQADTLQGELENKVHQKLLPRDEYQELKGTMTVMQETIAAELQAEKQKNQFLRDELDSVRVMYHEVSCKYDTELNHIKQEAETLRDELGQEVHLKSALDKEHEELKEIVRGMQESFATELQIEKQRNRLLQMELKGVSVSYQHHSNSFESELNKAKKEVETLQHKLEDEVQEKSTLLDFYEELQTTLKCCQVNFVDELTLERRKNNLLQKELDSVNILCNEKSFSFESELSNVRHQAHILQVELQHEVHQKSLLQHEYEKLKETMLHMQGSFAAELQVEKDNNKLLRDKLEGVNVSSHGNSLNFQTELNNLREQAKTLQGQLENQIHQKSLLQRKHQELQETMKHMQETMVAEVQLEKKKNELLLGKLSDVHVSNHKDTGNFDSELNNVQQQTENHLGNLEHKVNQWPVIENGQTEHKETKTYMQETLAAELQVEKRKNAFLRNEVERLNLLYQENSHQFETELSNLRKKANTLQGELELAGHEKLLLQKEHEALKESMRYIQVTITAELHMEKQKNVDLREKLERMNFSCHEDSCKLEVQLFNFRQQVHILQCELEDEIQEKFTLLAMYEELHAALNHSQGTFADDLLLEREKSKVLKEELEEVNALYHLECLRFETEQNKVTQQVYCLQHLLNDEIHEKFVLLDFYEELQATLNWWQFTFADELVLEKRKNMLHQEELEMLNMSFHKQCLGLVTELNNVRQQADNLQLDFQREVNQNSLFQKEHVDLKENIRCMQESFSAELQMEKEKNKLLQTELEGVKVSYTEDSHKFETELINMRKQADNLQGDLQYEVRQKTVLQKQNKELKDIMRRLKEAIAAEIHVEKQTNILLQDKLDGVKVAHHEECSRYETELNSLRQQADTLQGELQHEVYQKSILQKDYKELKEKIRQMQETIGAELQSEKQRNTLLQKQLEGVRLSYNKSCKIETELNNVKQQADTLQCELQLEVHQKSLLQKQHAELKKTVSRLQETFAFELQVEREKNKLLDNEQESIQSSSTEDYPDLPRLTRKSSVWKRARNFLGLRKSKKRKTTTDE